MRHALVTGGAGFIGSHLVDRLLHEGWRTTVIDNFDPFYPRVIKFENIRHHLADPNFNFFEIDIRDYGAVERVASQGCDIIVHLAARAGVRPSIADPIGYHEVNGRGTQNLLEIARHIGVKHFVFASSSSVYGVNPRVPWAEDDAGLLPISPYASTKLSGEFMGHVYSKLYGIRFTALRFFTVYGPRQRPDLAIHQFARLLMENKPVKIFGDGSTRRDYTHVSDIVNGICSAMDYNDSSFEVFNLGNNYTVDLRLLLRTLEKAIGCKARVEHLPEQPGDVRQTWADISKAGAKLSYKPSTTFSAGIEDFISWLKISNETHRSIREGVQRAVAIPAGARS
jgi:UDP-glucuronate 4-epimerase